jgi:OOP family OmpA-OmpF porin
MKKIIFIATLLVAIPEIKAQETKTTSSEFNKWSIDVNAGFSKPTAPFSTNYYSSNTNFIHGDLGVRYMMNNKFGLKLDFGLDSFKNDSESFEFEGKYYRTSIQGVVNLGRVLNFEDWTNTINLQAHSGVGFSFMTNDNFDGNDDMTNFILGLTAQFKLSNRVALNADFSMINNVNQQYTFDGIEEPAVKEDRGFNSTIYNASIGLSIYLGKHGKHADWDTSNSKLDELERRVTELEIKLLDTDKYGVADYLDEEKKSAQNAIVDTKGRTIDGNNNGIDDKVEAYVDDKTKVTPTEGQSIEDMINGGYITVLFDFNSSQPTADSYSAINFVTQYLKSNPNSSVEIVGYADEIGKSEYNKTLSASRANFVKDVITKAGINASRLTVAGQGEDASVDASSADARRLVRKVIFKLK